VCTAHAPRVLQVPRANTEHTLTTPPFTRYNRVRCPSCCGNCGNTDDSCGGPSGISLFLHADGPVGSIGTWSHTEAGMPLSQSLIDWHETAAILIVATSAVILGVLVCVFLDWIRAARSPSARRRVLSRRYIQGVVLLGSYVLLSMLAGLLGNAFMEKILPPKAQRSCLASLGRAACILVPMFLSACQWRRWRLQRKRDALNEQQMAEAPSHADGPLSHERTRR